jgi:hypothetical protein
MGYENYNKFLANVMCTIGFMLASPFGMNLGISLIFALTGLFLIYYACNLMNEADKAKNRRDLNAY